MTTYSIYKISDGLMNYVGSTKNYDKRWKGHIYYASWDDHPKQTPVQKYMRQVGVEKCQISLLNEIIGCKADALKEEQRQLLLLPVETRLNAQNAFITDAERKAHVRMKNQEHYAKFKADPAAVEAFNAKEREKYNSKRNDEAFMEKKRIKSRRLYAKEKDDPKFKEAKSKKNAEARKRMKLNPDYNSAENIEKRRVRDKIRNDAYAQRKKDEKIACAKNKE